MRVREEAEAAKEVEELIELIEIFDEAVIVGLNMSGIEQKASFDLGPRGFSDPSAETLITTFKAHLQQISLSSVSLEPFSVYIEKSRR